MMIFFLFLTFCATPKTNFIISDFWRWLVVHMWVEVTFEIFTVVFVAYLYREMSIVSKAKAEPGTYFAVMLFFVTAVISVGNIFCLSAKPTGASALGSVFATNQVFPLIMLTLDAWKHTQIEELPEEGGETGKLHLVMGEVWLLFLGGNFWNVPDVGHSGSMINLPVIDYYEHAAFFTRGHAHGAIFSVKENIALASILYYVRHVVEPEVWCPNSVGTAFWSMNRGIARMMVLSMLPTGFYLFYQNINYGM